MDDFDEAFFVKVKTKGPETETETENLLLDINKL